MLSRWCYFFIIISLLVMPAWADQPVSPPSTSQPAPQSAQSPCPKLEDEYELQRMLIDTIDQVERNYVKDISRRELIEAAINGILEKLDPYSSYITPDELDQFRGSMESEFGGIGIQLTMDHGQFEVLSPLVNTPAYEAGILSGDQILEIDGRPTEGVELDTLIRWLKGKVGTEVVLSVLHPNKTSPETIRVTRRQIQVETVMGDHRKKNDSWDFMIDPEKKIGYIRIVAFSRTTADELRKVLKSLEKENLTGLVLDLRFNPGGLLCSAIEVSDLFIEKGTIVSTSGRNVSTRAWEAHEKNTFPNVPMVVLVNRFTASAGEIVSACLQDHKRAIIMGERTWGKGSVQNVIPMEHGRSALKLTTASYKRPSGKNIHRFPDASDEDNWGVTPDEGYRVELSNPDLLALIQNRRDRDIIHPKRTGPTPNQPSPIAPKNPSSDVAYRDRVLRMAIERLSSELVKAQ